LIFRNLYTRLRIDSAGGSVEASVAAQDRKPGRDDRDFVKIPMSGTTRELA
jgi:hypothetical protein